MQWQRRAQCGRIQGGLAKLSRMIPQKFFFSTVWVFLAFWVPEKTHFWKMGPKVINLKMLPLHFFVCSGTYIHGICTTAFSMPPCGWTSFLKRCYVYRNIWKTQTFSSLCWQGPDGNAFAEGVDILLLCMLENHKHLIFGKHVSLSTKMKCINNLLVNIDI